MRNLHRYFYRIYFSAIQENIVHNPKISFANLSLEEEKKRLSDSEEDRERRKELSEKIGKIEKCNVAVIEYRNSIFCAQNYTNFRNPIPMLSLDKYQIFPLCISYPGLVTGVGVNHEAKIEGEFKLGVHFDYTYGMPVVYGSSVKGVLRNSFILKQEHGKILEYEPYFLNKITGTQWGQKEIEALFNDIFEGEDANGPKSIYNRDIFFDAVLVKADQKGRILCSDSITPHGDNPLKNPTPLTFLKIAPGCELEFRFKLVDSVIDGKTFSAEQKKALFNEIIRTVGVGAKTNVGYGQFQ